MPDGAPGVRSDGLNGGGEGVALDVPGPLQDVAEGELPARFVEGYADKTMLHHMGVMGKDIKGAIVFLASGASDYVTGHNLVVDGGFSVWK